MPSVKFGDGYKYASKKEWLRARRKSVRLGLEKKRRSEGKIAQEGTIFEQAILPNLGENWHRAYDFLETRTVDFVFLHKQRIVPAEVKSSTKTTVCLLKGIMQISEITDLKSDKLLVCNGRYVGIVISRFPPRQSPKAIALVRAYLNVNRHIILALAPEPTQIIFSESNWLDPRYDTDEFFGDTFVVSAKKPNKAKLHALIEGKGLPKK